MRVFFIGGSFLYAARSSDRDEGDRHFNFYKIRDIPLFQDLGVFSVGRGAHQSKIHRHTFGSLVLQRAQHFEGALQPRRDVLILRSRVPFVHQRSDAVMLGADLVGQVVELRS